LNPFEADVIRVADPLSQHTRSVRKSLLVASIVATAIATTGLIPAKISALGIEFSRADRGSMLWLLAVIVGFLLISFTVTAAADFTAWRMSFSAKAWDEESRGYDNLRRVLLEERSLTDQDREDLGEVERRIGSMWRNDGHLDRHMLIEKVVGPVSWARATVEFVAPLIAGVTALVLLGNASL
jgi:hypothetical protein